MNSYRTLWPYLRRHRYRLAAGLAALLWVDFLQLMIPRVTKHAVDQLYSQTATAVSLAWAGLTILALAATIGVFRYVWRRLILGFSRLVEEDLRRRLYAKLLTLPPAWFMARTTGDIMAHATNDMEAIRMAAGLGLVALTDSFLMGAASIGFMAWINGRLTLLALIPMPLVTILTWRLGGLMHRRFRQVQETFGGMTGVVREYLAGIRVIQAHGREDLALADLDRVGRRYVSENVRLTRVSGAFFPLMIMFTNVSLALVLFFGGRMTIFSTISPGDFVAFISYLGLLTWPMMALGWMMDLIQRGAASLDRLNRILEQKPEIRDPDQPQDLIEPFGAVTARGLTFAYPGRPEPVLRDLELVCPAGQVTAIVGPIGAGKSTLLNLIPRLFDPPAGTLFLDGREVGRLRLSDLRGGIGYVPQDGYIFSGTMAENIAFGRPQAGEAEIRAAAKAAQLDDEIMAFPDGYRTIVGERGLTLSGGQRLRLALARAILIDPPLLILDDTFAALDAEAEEKILETLAQARTGRTTIIVSHRLTSLKSAALIHVLENGRVTESGGIEELLARGGYFAHLYHLQSAWLEGLDNHQPLAAGQV
ncbi:MAG: ABC transporter ATP-binding protein [Thermodesulfobacteriota bacterium]